MNEEDKKQLDKMGNELWTGIVVSIVKGQIISKGDFKLDSHQEMGATVIAAMVKGGQLDIKAARRFTKEQTIKAMDSLEKFINESK